MQLPSSITINEMKDLLLALEPRHIMYGYCNCINDIFLFFTVIDGYECDGDVDVVLLYCGGNDLASGEGVEMTLARYERLLELAR